MAGSDYQSICIYPDGSIGIDGSYHMKGGIVLGFDKYAIHVQRSINGNSEPILTTSHNDIDIRVLTNYRVISKRLMYNGDDPSKKYIPYNAYLVIYSYLDDNLKPAYEFVGGITGSAYDDSHAKALSEFNSQLEQGKLGDFDPTGLDLLDPCFVSSNYSSMLGDEMKHASSPYYALKFFNKELVENGCYTGEYVYEWTNEEFTRLGLDYTYVGVPSEILGEFCKWVNEESTNGKFEYTYSNNVVPKWVDTINQDEYVAVLTEVE